MILVQVSLNRVPEKRNWTVELIRGPENRPQAQGTVMYVNETVRLEERREGGSKMAARDNRELTFSRHTKPEEEQRAD